MRRKVTAEEQAHLDKIKEIRESLDYEFIAKDVAARLVILSNEDKVKSIGDAMHAIALVCVAAATSQCEDAIEHAELSVDVSIDYIRKLMSTAILLDTIAAILDRIIESDNDGLRDQLNPEDSDLNKKLEQTRTRIIRGRIDRELRAKRRR